MNKAPIKRSNFLKPLSREHHHGLLLCWKIKTGFSKNIEIERIKNYTDWFFEANLKTHFKLEEEIAFPVLGNNHLLVERAISEHKRLRELFSEKIEIKKSLLAIEHELEQHIRFEERILFNEIEQLVTSEIMESINQIHNNETISDDWKDEFWK
ncbi:MAG: hemerythrin domain-containing protein [Bacteroidetes bacterium]|nr:hemerythrin domain-containing protein [Bacteroidota bacterium]